MIYLILQILFCLLIAFLLGLLIGWLLCRWLSCGAKSCDNTKANPAEHHAASAMATPPPPPATTTAKPTYVAPAPVKTDTRSATAKLEALDLKEKEPVKAAIEPITTAEITVDSNVDLNSDGYEIETLEGVGPKTGDSLRAIGIATIEDLLKKASTASERTDIADKISVRPKMVNSWVSMSDLLRVGGIDHQAAELVHVTGIHTIGEFAKQDAGILVAKMTEANTAGKRSIAPSVPEKADIISWIEAASKLKAVVKI